MHLPSALLVTRLAIGVSAIYPVDGTNYGIESDLIATPLAPDTRVVNDVYNHCKELDEDSVQVSEGEECVWNALQYMIQALSDAQSVTRVALLSNTVDNMQSILQPSCQYCSYRDFVFFGTCSIKSRIAAVEVETSG